MLQNFKASFVRVLQRVRAAKDTYLERRPHRSFRLSKRREYARSLAIPGLFSLTHSVNKTLWQFRKQFIWITVFYGVLTALFIGLGSQETYSTLVTTLRESSAQAFSGDWAQLGQASLLFASIASSGLSATPTELQQIYAVILGLLTWLTTVWLLRNLLAGHKVKFRDGLYNAGAPIVPMFLVSLTIVLQLIPLGLAIIGYSAAHSSGLLDSGIAAMLFWVAASLLAVLSLYWVISTFFALIIITLPGMYPLQALKIAGDMVIGRRLRILGRLAWMLFVVGIGWAVLLIPFILIDGWIKSVWPALEWLPIVPFFLLIVSTVSVVWSSAYVYIFYRKVVDDNASPA